LAASVSRIPIRITISEKGTANGDVFKHFAPRTVNDFLRSLPLQGRVNHANSFVYMTSKLIVGGEKRRTAFSRNEMAFLPLNGSICIFLMESKVERPMNPIGRITSGMEVLDTVTQGDVMEIQELANA
jgi:hypothetical protein